MIRDLLDQFICVRIVKGNTIDLSLFQFDYDLTFAMVFLNAKDRSIYGRFGTRDSVKDAEKDISLAGLRATLEGVLELHQNYESIKGSLAGKQPRPTKFKTPLDYPALGKKYKNELDFGGQVSRSCIHCHQVRVSELQWRRAQGQAIDDPLAFSHPRPEVLGIKLDSNTRARVKSITAGSAAAKGGLQTGDEIVELDGQPILSMADVQWVLHTAPEQGSVSAKIRRTGQDKKLELPLAADWRKESDLNWRVSTWDLRRMLGGGMVLEEPSAADRTSWGLSADSLALRIRRLGRYGDHAIARKSGFKEGDILTSYNGLRERLTESQLLIAALQSTHPGEQIEATVLREGKSVTVRMKLPAAELAE